VWKHIGSYHHPGRPVLFARTICNAQDYSRTIVKNESAVLIFRVSGGRPKNCIHKNKTLSLAPNQSSGMLARPTLRATIPPTMAAFVSQSPPALIVLPMASTKCPG